MKKFIVMVLALAVFLSGFSVLTADAAEVIVQNTLDNRVSISLTYFDRSTGLWTTKGWWNVAGNDDRTIIINNVDESKAS
jgi:uncharacterized membrane protein